jgi:hypothetical protein
MKTEIIAIGTNQIKIESADNILIDEDQEESIIYAIQQNDQCGDIFNSSDDVIGLWELMDMSDIVYMAQHPIFISFAETFGIMCASGNYVTKIASKQEIGQIGAINLLMKWAVEFESKNSGRFWDGELYEEIDTFMEQKYNSLIK